MVRSLVVPGGAKLGRFIIVFILLSALLVSLPTVVEAKLGWGDGEFQYPGDVAVDSSGNIYVADTSNYRIQKFDSSGNFITKWGFVSNPVAITVDSSGDVYVVDCNNKRIQKFNGAGELLATWDSYETNGQTCHFVSPRDVVVDSSGNVFILDSDTLFTTADYRIVKLDDEGGYLGRWGSPGTDPGQINIPTGIALDSSGNVYVVDQWADYDQWPPVSYSRIQKFDSEGGFIAEWGSYGNNEGQLRFPVNLAFDSDDNAYVVDWWIESDWPVDFNPRIQKFDSEGVYIKHWGSEGTGDGQFQSPDGIAVDSLGNVYVADTGNHRIQKFTSDGVVVNLPPVADAGPDLERNEGTTVTLTSYSYDLNSLKLTFQWSQVAGQVVELSNSDTPEASFMAPEVSSNEVLTFQLTVSDGVATASDTVNVTILNVNDPPVAVAGPDQTVIPGETVYFDGSGSYDPYPIWDWIESYEWDFGDGNSVIKVTPTATHTYSECGTYEVTLTVKDYFGATGTDTLMVTVQTPEGAIQGLISDVESMNLPKGIENSLISKLENAIASLSRDQKNVTANKLHAFIKEVEAQRGKEITNTQADDLIAKAQLIIDNI